MRVISSIRSKEGENEHYCPRLDKKMLREGCNGCAQFGSYVERKATYKVNCLFPEENELEIFKPSKADDSIGKLKGNDVIQSTKHTIVEPKLDGARAIVHATPEGVFITSRRLGRDGTYSQFQDKVPHLRDSKALIAAGRYGYTVLDAEILMESEDGSFTLGPTMSVLQASSDKAVATQEREGKLSINVFDIMWLNSQDLRSRSLFDRKIILDGLFEGSLGNEPYINKVKAVYNTDVETKQRLFDEALARGEEGIMIKDPDATYGGTKNMLKVKESMTIDARVHGFEYGAKGGKWEHTLGALLFEVIDKATGEWRELGKTVPGTDETRAELFDKLNGLEDNAIRDLEMIIEIKGQGWTEEHRVRHPRILKLRPDKNTVTKVRFPD